MLSCILLPYITMFLSSFARSIISLFCKKRRWFSKYRSCKKFGLICSKCIFSLFTSICCVECKQLDYILTPPFSKVCKTHLITNVILIHFRQYVNLEGHYFTIFANFKQKNSLPEGREKEKLFYGNRNYSRVQYLAISPQ